MKNVRKIAFHITTVKNRYNLHPSLKAALQSCAQRTPLLFRPQTPHGKTFPKIKKAHKTFLPKTPGQPPSYVNSNRL